MVRKLVKVTGIAVASLSLAATLAFAGMSAEVIEIGEQGTAIVQTEDGKEHTVKLSGVQIGDTVDCSEKDGTLSCTAAK